MPANWISLLLKIAIALLGRPLCLRGTFPLFKGLDAKLIPIKAEGKAAYHAAAVMASNYLVTLAASAIDLQTEAGISPLLARQITEDLMQSSLANIQQTNKIAMHLLDLYYAAMYKPFKASSSFNQLQDRYSLSFSRPCNFTNYRSR